MYNHENQYRCTIIRGKSQSEMDDLLPVYALIIDKICPCRYKEFEIKFNQEFKKFLPESKRKKKTLDNHRTEISGKLFGMYYCSDNGMIYESERTKKYLHDNDQPAFFKDICYKMQFPNGTQKSSTVMKRMKANINVRPCAFILKLLQISQLRKVVLNTREIAYYVLNSLDVLQGKATPNEVLKAIVSDRNNNIERDINVSGKEKSYTHQHIKEQLNIMELANLIRVTDNKDIILNMKEHKSIDLIAQEYNSSPIFDVYSYKFDTVEQRKYFQYKWNEYYSKLSNLAGDFATDASSLAFSYSDDRNKTNAYTNIDNTFVNIDTGKKSNVEIGDEGELIVFEYEKQRVRKFDKRLVNKVLSLGKTRGLGYDIQSVVAQAGEMPEFAIYIEVKSTKRYTVPNSHDDMWIDTLNITRNEWTAAQQHGKFYYIYRVYFTSQGIFIFVISNIADKERDNKLQVIPTMYRIEFSNKSIDEIIKIK